MSLGAMWKNPRWNSNIPYLIRGYYNLKFYGKSIKFKVGSFKLNQSKKI